MNPTNGCLIRLMDSRDLAQVYNWRNHPNVRRHMLTQHEISQNEHQHWFERASIDPSRRLLIVEEDGISLGFVHFSNIESGCSADWGFYSAPEAEKGTGRKIGNAALDYAFDNLRLHKVCGQALAFNEASIKFHLALGFRREGVLRDQHRIQDAYHDLICFGLLDHEWKTNSSQ